jgi:protein FAM50
MADPSDTPNASRFASSAHTAEDLLKSQTVGLVHLSDFRKRRAEALEQSEGGSGTSTPTGGDSRYVAIFSLCDALWICEDGD